MEFVREKAAALTVTLAVVALLIISGPAAAFSVKLNGFDNINPVSGDKVNAVASIEIRNDERMDFDVELLIDNAKYCGFDIYADNVICNNGINVSLVNSSLNYGFGYGYGYGYGYNYGYGFGYSNGIATYKIIIDTAYFSVGNHSIELRVSAGSRVYNSEKQSIIINAANPVNNDGGNNGGGVIFDRIIRDNNLNDNNAGNEEDNLDNIDEIDDINGDVNGRSSITGAVIGALGGAKVIVVIAFIFALIAGLIIANVMRKRHANIEKFY